MTRLVARAWVLARSRLLWGWRFHSLGPGSAVGSCRLVRNPQAISIGHHTTILGGWAMADLVPSKPGPGPKLRIGNHCEILYDFHCNAGLSVEIQDYVLMAPRVFITDSDHVVDPEGEHTTESKQFDSAPVVVEHDCWLGVNCVILKGVRIGHHSIIGANAVVTKDVPPFSRVGGVPARALGMAAAR